MKVKASQIRNYRLHINHLDKKVPMDEMLNAAGVCGLQNTPPGAWETALFNRLEGCTLNSLNVALNIDKTLLQAWSYRGVPVVFPTKESDIFLSSLIPEEGEQPWIYTQGIADLIDYLQMPFEDLLFLTKKAAQHLDTYVIKSKRKLDQALADIIEVDLPKEKITLWREPSMYDNLEKQTVGEAIVSFLLRPCSFNSLVVFGERQGNRPTFTSFKNWTGHMPISITNPGKELIRKYLHCYGPATLDYFMKWLGCSKLQAKRLWNSVVDELVPVEVNGNTCYMLSADCDNLLSFEANNESIVLLGAHDPYLDLKDRSIILENKTHQKNIWKFASNPGVILKGGSIIGAWKEKKMNDKLDISINMWEMTTSAEQELLNHLAQEYASFRLLNIRKYTMESTCF